MILALFLAFCKYIKQALLDNHLAAATEAGAVLDMPPGGTMEEHAWLDEAGTVWDKPGDGLGAENNKIRKNLKNLLTASYRNLQNGKGPSY